MPPKTPKPRKLKWRIPKGTTRADYTPEALQEMDRNNWRVRKARQRKRQRHRGHREVTIPFGQAAWDEIDRRQDAEPGLTLQQLFTRLLLEKPHAR